MPGDDQILKQQNDRQLDIHVNQNVEQIANSNKFFVPTDININAGKEKMAHKLTKDEFMAQPYTVEEANIIREAGHKDSKKTLAKQSIMRQREIKYNDYVSRYEVYREQYAEYQKRYIDQEKDSMVVERKKDIEKLNKFKEEQLALIQELKKYNEFDGTDLISYIERAITAVDNIQSFGDKKFVTESEEFLEANLQTLQTIMGQVSYNLSLAAGIVLNLNKNNQYNDIIKKMIDSRNLYMTQRMNLSAQAHIAFEHKEDIDWGTLLHRAGRTEILDEKYEVGKFGGGMNKGIVFEKNNEKLFFKKNVVDVKEDNIFLLNKNMANERMAELFGVRDTIVHSRVHCLKQKDGTSQIGLAMEEAEGLNGSELMSYVEKNKIKEIIIKPDVQHKLRNLQVFDAIMGQADRSFNNIVYKFNYDKTDRRLVISDCTGIDNDGVLNGNYNIYMGDNIFDSPGLFEKDGEETKLRINEMDEELYHRIMNMDDKSIVSPLSGIIPMKFIQERLLSRFKIIKKQISTQYNNGTLKLLKKNDWKGVSTSDKNFESQIWSDYAHFFLNMMLND